MHTRVHLLWRDRSVSRKFKTGVSLHSHTMHSRESLTFIPIYAQHIPLLAWELNRLARATRPVTAGRSITRGDTGRLRFPHERPTNSRGGGRRATEPGGIGLDQRS